MQVNPNLFNLIKFTAEQYGLDLRTDYSGRCMYGRECVGVVGQMHDIQNFLKEVTSESHYADDESEMFEDWLCYCFDYRQDSMGLDIIIYWPDMEAPEEEEN